MQTAPLGFASLTVKLPTILIVWVGVALVLIAGLLTLWALGRQRNGGIVKRGTGNIARLGPYRDLKRLGKKGKRSRMYTAFNAPAGRKCLLKVLRTDLISDLEAIEVFELEGAILKKIKRVSPDAPVVSVFATGTIQTGALDVPFIELEYIPGQTDLTDYLRRQGRIEPETAERMLVQVARSVAAAHEVGWIHGNLNPSSVLLYEGDPERLVVCDFGVTAPPSSHEEALQGNISARYLAPEQCVPGGTLCEETDIYALGLLFYELVAGSRLFEDDDPSILMTCHRDESPIAVVERDVPKRYVPLLLRMLSKEPENRPTVTDLLASLSCEALVTPGQKPKDVELALMTYTPSLVDRLISIPPSVLATFGATALLGLLVLSLIVVFLSGSQKQPNRDTQKMLSQKSASPSNPAVPEEPPVEITPMQPETLPENQEEYPKLDPGGGLGIVYVTSDPTGATVILNRDVVGQTPHQAVSVPAGKHLMRLELKGYEPIELEISVPRDDVWKKAFSFAQAQGAYLITTNPAEAFIYVDGIEQGISPLRIELEPGTHTIRAVSGEKARESELVVEPGDKSRVNLVLEKQELHKKIVERAAMTMITDRLGAPPEDRQREEELLLALLPAPRAAAPNKYDTAVASFKKGLDLEEESEATEEERPLPSRNGPRAEAGSSLRPQVSAMWNSAKENVSRLKFDANRPEQRGRSQHNPDAKESPRLLNTTGEPGEEDQLDPGKNLLAREKYDAAIKEFETALGLDPQNMEARRLLANARARKAASEAKSRVATQKKIAELTGGMVKIPGGTFVMGSPDSESGRDRDEGPLHKVRISRSFWMGKSPVTWAQYQTVMDESPGGQGRQPDHAPVYNVSWMDAVKYCNALSALTGLQPAYRISWRQVIWNRNANGFRLPTEAEWEYACQTASPQTHRSRGVTRGRLGVLGMLDGPRQWCWDRHGGYSSRAATDPTGPKSGSKRVSRGCADPSDRASCRLADRFSDRPGKRRTSLGFRVCRSTQ